MKAPIIVLEGLDACGKSTQTDLLCAELKKRNIITGFVRFPGYETTPAGKRIAAYLRGEFGEFKDIDPKIIACLYAEDRLAQLERIEKIREKSDVVIFDRGVTSNLIYTPAHAKNEEIQNDLFEFIEKLEYEIHGFPRESLVIFLDASEEARKKIHQAKGRLADIHEANEKYLSKVRENALLQCKKDFRWVRIVVDRTGELRRRDEISREILALVLEKLQLNK